MSNDYFGTLAGLTPNPHGPFYSLHLLLKDPVRSQSLSHHSTVISHSRFRSSVLLLELPNRVDSVVMAHGLPGMMFLYCTVMGSRHWIF
jgi:hypothetical protein